MTSVTIARHDVTASYIYRVRPFLRDRSYCSKSPRREHDFVIIDQRVFVYAPENITTSNMVTNLCHHQQSHWDINQQSGYFEGAWCKIPLNISVKSVRVNPTRDVDRV